MKDHAPDDNAKLAHMAHQIAEFFRPYGAEEAARAIANHINEFWTPRMRGDFLNGPAPDDPLVRAAIAFIRPGKAV